MLLGEWLFRGMKSKEGPCSLASWPGSTDIFLAPLGNWFLPYNSTRWGHPEHGGYWSDSGQTAGGACRSSPTEASPQPSRWILWPRGPPRALEEWRPGGGRAAGRAACAGTVTDRWRSHSRQHWEEMERLGQQGWTTSHPEGRGGRNRLQGAPVSVALSHAADGRWDTAGEGGGGLWRPCRGLSVGCEGKRLL